MFLSHLSFAVVSGSLWLVLLLGFPLSARAENEVPQPILVEADRMEAEQQQHAVFFSGNVEATQGELVIHADEMKIDYGEPDSQGDQVDHRRFKKVFAKGSVEVVKAGWLATGDSLEYFAEDRKVVVIGDAKAWQGKNMVAGDSIVLYLDEGRSVAEKGTGPAERVKAVIYPDGD